MEKLNKKQLANLRSESKGWTHNKWEEYLQTLEHQRSESLIHPVKYEELKEENPFLWEDYEKSDENNDLILKLKEAFKNLTFKQKKVLKMLFWDNLIDEEIAEKMGTSRRAIRNIKTQGLQRLKSILVPLSPYIEGGSVSDALKSISKTNSCDSFFKPQKEGENYVA